MQSPKPAGMCETELKVSVDGVTQWNPDITVSVRTNGDTVPLGLFLLLCCFFSITKASGLGQQ